MATIGEVTIKLGGDATQLVRTLGSATSSITSAVGKIVKVGSIITGAFAGIASIGLGVFVNQVSKLGDEFSRINILTGVSVETLSALKLSAELNKSSFEELGNSFKFMQRNLSDAIDGTGEAKPILDSMGFTVADLQNGLKNTDVFLEQFAKKIAEIESPARRVQAAMDVMGRAGSNMIPFLLDLADRGLAGVRKESDELGVTFSTKLAKSSERFRDNMERLGAALQGLKVTIIGPLVAAFAALTTQFLKSDLFASIRAQIDALASSGKLEEWAKRSVFFVIDAFMNMTRSIAIIFPVAAEVVVETLRSISSALAGALANWAGILGNMTISFGSFFDHMASLPLIGGAFRGLGSQVRQVGGEVVNSMHQASQSVQQFSDNLEVPQSVEAISDTLRHVAASVHHFGTEAKASFDTVKQEIAQVAGVADKDLTPSVYEARTASGQLVKVSGGVGMMFDQATGSVTIMNRELFGTLQIVRQINAEAVRPVQ